MSGGSIIFHRRNDLSFHFYLFQFLITLLEGVQTVQNRMVFHPERSEPSSRNFLIGEQPNPWNLLQLQDKLSRHRGAELRRRYELLDGTSLLSPE